MPVTTVSHISTFSPTQCGIATYTEDLIRHLKGIHPIRARLVYDTEASQPGFDNTIDIGNADTYDRAIESINSSKTDLVSLQHEFGIYGGQHGEYVVRLAEGIKKPIVTTFHTVFAEMSISRRKIVESLLKSSKLVVVLTEESKTIVTSGFTVLPTKIRVIKHGVPYVDFVFPETTNIRKGSGTPLVFVSAGHVRPAKGYDIALRALALYSSHNPHFKYLILGTDQPHVDKGAREYRSHLWGLINELNLGDKVIWIDKYLDLEDLLQHIIAADIGLMTYTRPFQSSSGILPLVLGCGRLAIATSFDYAKSIVKQIEGIRLADMNNPCSVSERICEITQNRKEMHSLMRANYLATRGWVWENAAAQYEQVFTEALA